MDLQNLVFTQIAIELALFIAIIIVLWRVNSNIKKPASPSQQKMAGEIKKMIAESQMSADIFLKSLEESRITLHQIALKLDEKEKNLKELLVQAQQKIEQLENKPATKDNTFSQSRYSEVVNMIKKGFSEEETAKITGFTEGEIELIIDLAKAKNGNT